MSYLKNIFIFVGISISAEIAFLIYKTIRRNFSQDINDFIAFDDSRYTCNKANQNDCFNPSCRLHNLNKILSKLDSVKFSIDLCMYVFNCPDLTDAVIRARRRGVVVRVITDPEIGFSKNSANLILYKEGILIRWKKSAENIMHHKFCILDGPQCVSELRNKCKGIDSHRFTGHPIHRNGLVMTGSMNWTHQATNGNWETLILTSDLSTVSEFEAIFNNLWKDFAVH